GDALPATPSAYGLGVAADLALSGGIDDSGVRRSITDAEAQARLGELAASRAARAPKTVLPTQGRLTTCYCMRWGQMHYGLDLAAPLGTPIYAAADGVVLKAGRVSGFGNAVYIQDADGNVHLYGHMRYYDVEAGQIVHAGDQIAKVGNEGYSTGPHLHYEIHRGGMDGRPTDPEHWLPAAGAHILVVGPRPPPPPSVVLRLLGAPPRPTSGAPPGPRSSGPCGGRNPRRGPSGPRS